MTTTRPKLLARLARSRVLVGVLAAAFVAAGLVAFWRLRSAVQQSLDAPLVSGRPLQFIPVMANAPALDRWGDGTVRALVEGPAGPITAGGSGVRETGRDLSPGLPTLRASALSPWRGETAAALEAGGLFRRHAGRWEELRSGFGTLHVRALLETPGGDLLVGARQGLFRAAWGAAVLERLDGHPVRAIADGPGFVLAGGEDGLYRVETGRVVRLGTPDPWVESLGLVDDELVVVTAAGLARGRLGTLLLAEASGGDVAQGVVHDGRFWGTAAPPLDVVLRFDPAGRRVEERLPAIVRRVMAAGGELFADTDDGLFRREASGWRRAVPRPKALPAGEAHVGALAWLGKRLVSGSFDGGLAVSDGRAAWLAVPGSAAWGVNALLPAGGALYVASLRGAARFDGTRLVPIDGPGAAFSLAATRDGVAIGYGQGVLLPGATLLSAFHGLPGNQALALAAGDGLFVGTPSGLGALDGRRVRWRVTAGEGKLPHPWVTALHVAEDGLYVGTYGGGLARRAAGQAATGRALADATPYRAFEETAGLKVNTGCLVDAGGRLYAGTDGRGVWRLSRDRTRFERLDLPLPSPRVTALVGGEGALWIGTDEGISRLPLEEGP
jgi:hypothetical protein